MDSLALTTTANYRSTRTDRPYTQTDSNSQEILLLSSALAFFVITTILATVAALFYKKKVPMKNDKSDKSKQVPHSASCINASGKVPISSITNGTVLLPSIEEYNQLRCYKNDLGQRFTTAQGLRYNKVGMLNLVPTNLPFDHNRVKLKRRIDGCDYVNASWITPPFDQDGTYDQLIYSSHLPMINIRR